MTPQAQHQSDGAALATALLTAPHEILATVLTLLEETQFGAAVRSEVSSHLPHSHSILPTKLERQSKANEEWSRPELVLHVLTKMNETLELPPRHYTNFQDFEENAEILLFQAMQGFALVDPEFSATTYEEMALYLTGGECVAGEQVADFCKALRVSVADGASDSVNQCLKDTWKAGTIFGIPHLLGVLSAGGTAVKGYFDSKQRLKSWVALMGLSALVCCESDKRADPSGAAVLRAWGTVRDEIRTATQRLCRAQLSLTFVERTLRNCEAETTECRNRQVELGKERKHLLQQLSPHVRSDALAIARGDWGPQLLSAGKILAELNTACEAAKSAPVKGIMHRVGRSMRAAEAEVEAVDTAEKLAAAAEKAWMAGARGATAEARRILIHLQSANDEAAEIEQRLAKLELCVKENRSEQTRLQKEITDAEAAHRSARSRFVSLNQLA